MKAKILDFTLTTCSCFVHAVAHGHRREARPHVGELAEFGLDLARKLHDQAVAAEEPEVVADLAQSSRA